MAADYTRHEDDFKNTHPLNGCIKEISSRYSLTLILNYQCYNQDLYDAKSILNHVTKRCPNSDFSNIFYKTI
jgi:hypothetical protein